MAFLDEVAACEVRDKLKAIQRLCKDDAETTLASNVEVIELCEEAVELRHDNAKPIYRNNVLQKGVKDVQPLEFLVCFNLEVLLASIKPLNVRVRDAVPKYVMKVEETTQAEVDLCLRTTLFEGPIVAEMDHIAQWERRDHGDIFAGGENMLAYWPGIIDTLNCQLKR